MEKRITGGGQERREKERKVPVDTSRCGKIHTKLGE